VLDFGLIRRKKTTHYTNATVSSPQSKSASHSTLWRWSLTQASTLANGSTTMWDKFTFAASSEGERKKWLRAISSAVHATVSLSSSTNPNTKNTDMAREDDVATSAFDLHVMAVSSSAKNKATNGNILSGSTLKTSAVSRPMIPRGKRRLPTNRKNG
jgi:hypothetical protein